MVSGVLSAGGLGAMFFSLICGSFAAGVGFCSAPAVLLAAAGFCATLAFGWAAGLGATVGLLSTAFAGVEIAAGFDLAGTALYHDDTVA